MFNCPELVDRERCIDMAFSWMMQLFQVRLFHSYYKSGSVSPGSEIPRWLNNQHVGNCVSLDAPPVMHDHNWIGVAFCAIFAVPQETISAMGVSGPDRRYPDSASSKRKPKRKPTRKMNCNCRRTPFRQVQRDRHELGLDLHTCRITTWKVYPISSRVEFVSSRV
ncbi:hypothetical protein glysoja_040822 [Glycine soja]|uniref:C-JID domain-containing protein n=1 Tax=Glycine soja TaxID=3848 RepID=A0A0B2PGJ4_GLYSO|nr:hypothetical protein glysoja_040822 [Glycine soja]